MDQGLIHNPNETPSSYPTKFWGLFGMVTLTPHTTQQIFIGQFAKMDACHWLKCTLQYLKQYPLSPEEISTTSISYTYIFIEYLTFFI